jgi:hypothetical protein
MLLRLRRQDKLRRRDLEERLRHQASKVSCDRRLPRPQAQMPLPRRRPRADRTQALLHLRLGPAI